MGVIAEAAAVLRQALELTPRERADIAAELLASPERDSVPCEAIPHQMAQDGAGE